MLSRKGIKEIAKVNFKRNYWPCVGWLYLGGLITGIGTNFSNISSNFSNSTTYGGNSIPTEIMLPILMAVTFFSFIFFMVYIFAGTVTTAGVGYFSLQSYRGEKADGKDLFLGFKRYTHVLGGMLWMQLWVFIWTLPILGAAVFMIIFTSILAMASSSFVFASVGLILFFALIILAGTVLLVFKSLQYAFTHYILLDRPEIRPTQALKMSIQMTNGVKGELFVLGWSFFGWMILNVLTIGILGIFYVNPYMNIAYAGFYEERKRELFGQDELIMVEDKSLVNA